MDKKAIEDFIEQNGFAEIPLLQVQFGLTYKQAKSYVDGLVKSSVIKYDQGVRYVCVAFNKTGGGNKNGYDVEERSAPEEFVNRLLKEQCKKVCERIRAEKSDSLIEADGEILNWLSGKLEQYEDFGLYDAMLKAEGELLLAKCDCSDYKIEACTRVWKFFKDCTEAAFETLKKRLTT